MTTFPVLWRWVRAVGCNNDLDGRTSSHRCFIESLYLAGTFYRNFVWNLIDSFFRPVEFSSDSSYFILMPQRTQNLRLVVFSGLKFWNQRTAKNACQEYLNITILMIIANQLNFRNINKVCNVEHNLNVTSDNKCDVLSVTLTDLNTVIIWIFKNFDVVANSGTEDFHFLPSFPKIRSKNLIKIEIFTQIRLRVK